MGRLPVELRALIRRRRYGRWAFYAVVVVLSTTVFFEHLGCFGWRGSDHARFDQGVFTIEAVTRSGTLLLSAGPTRVETRLLGLVGDTVQPQSVAAYLGRRVIVKLEPLQTRDAAGRLLAYLYLDERTVLNIELVRQGAAKADRGFPHSLRSVIAAAESDARRRKRGVWGR